MTTEDVGSEDQPGWGEAWGGDGLPDQDLRMRGMQMEGKEVSDRELSLSSHY